MTPLGDPPTWAGRRRVLLRGGSVYSPVDPFATALLMDGPRIVWIGSDGASLAVADGVDEVVELDGALVTPAFVDAHVHVTTTGLALTGLDLTGTRSRAAALAAIAEHAAGLGPDDLVYGHGWQESEWPDGPVPDLEQMRLVCGGRSAFITRVDVHSSLVSPRFLDAHPQLADLPGREGAVLRAQAHYRAREQVLTTLSRPQREAAQRAARRRAAELGIGLLTEMSGPSIATEADLTDFLRLSRTEAGPLAAGYWGEAGGARKAKRLGAVGAGGDLFIDGSLGSRTAWLRRPYADDPHSCGQSFLDAAEVAEHLLQCQAEGLQAGFHAIGEAALDAAVAGLQLAAGRSGAAAVRSAGHRIEHAEMLHPGHIAVLADLGVTASVQPVFDALWGGSGGMYRSRVGERAATMNPFAALLAAGVRVAFGSDAPVTALGPWAAVRAAVNHRDPDQRISARAAFAAHSRGGWRAVAEHGCGVLAPGAPAHLTVWQVAELVVQAPDDRIQAWSTDPRSGTPGLPDMSVGSPDPVCLATVVAGAAVHRSADLDWTATDSTGRAR